MPRNTLNILVLVVAIAAGVYQFYVKEFLVLLGHNRVIESIGNKNCKKIPDIQACEKIVLHQPSGLLYLACSNPQTRNYWIPALSRLNATAVLRDDYVAVYNPDTSKVTQLKVAGFTHPGGLSLHGMDVVQSADDPSELFVYLINHRAPKDGKDATVVGADSVMEVFRTTVGGDTMTHIRTVEDPLFISPNDVVGSEDGKSFWFTNDHGEKVGLIRELDVLFGRKSTTVVYCHEKHGCKIAAKNMHGNNGIARAANGTFYVVDSPYGRLSILELQQDNTLVITDMIKTDRGMDNISLDSEGHLWAAAFPKVFLTINKHFADPTFPAPSTAFVFSRNTGPSAFYGEKYKIQKVFEDDGNVASGITSVVHDAQRKRLFLHGLAALHLTVCKID